MDIQFNNLSITSFLHRFHLVIFIAFLAVALSIVVLMLNGIINKSGDTSDIETISTSSNFDEETIERISELKTSSEPSAPLNFSGGRVNPFSE